MITCNIHTKLQCVGLPTGTTVDRYVIGTDRQAARRRGDRPASVRHFEDTICRELLLRRRWGL